MRLAATVARNTIAGFAGQTALRLLQLATSAVLARALGAAGFGDFGYLIAVITFFQFLGDLGVEKIAVREIARDPARAAELAGAAITLRAALSVAAALAAIVFFLAAAPSADLARLGALCALAIPLTLASIYPAYYQAMLRVPAAMRITLVQGAIASALLLAGALLPRLAPSLDGARLAFVTAAFALAGPASLAASAWLARADLRPRLSVDREAWGRLLRAAAPLAFNSICILVSLRADQVILRNVQGAEALGRYSAALRLYDALTVVPMVLLLSGFPIMARAAGQAPERLARTAAWNYRILSAFILPVALATTILAGPILRGVFGAPYAPAAPALALLTWSLFFSFSAMVTFDAITAAGRQRLFVGLSIFTTTLNLALNLWLIPRYGTTGAAVAALVNSAASLPVLAALGETRPFIAAFARESARPILATGLLALVFAAGVPRVPFLIGLLPAYFLLLRVTGGIRRGDLARLLGAIRPHA